MTQPITAFNGTYAFLSNFCTVQLTTWKGFTAMSVEHAFQAEKMVNVEDYHRVLACKTPGQAKRLARSLPMHPNWNDWRDGVMRYYAKQKFEKNPYLLAMLRATSDRYLIEGNNWGDTYWGAEWRIDQWYGQNKLGLILMSVRDELCR